jgi:hypothetical protein
MLRASSITSILALTFPRFSLWESSLKHSDLKVFVARALSVGSGVWVPAPLARLRASLTRYGPG